MPPDSGPTPAVNREWSLLLTCSRTRATEADFLQQRELADGLDWRRFLALVERHRVAPLVWANLIRHPAGVFPEQLMTELSAQHRGNALHVLAMTGEWVRLHRLLEEAHLSYTTLKGLPLALRYYGDPALRHGGDIDILVAEADFKRTLQVLTKAGYPADRELAGLTPRQLSYSLFAYHHCEFPVERSGLRVELHWRPMGNPHTFRPPNLSPGSAQIDHMTVANGDLPLLAQEEMLLYLCAHGAKHAWFRLKWLFDLPQVLESRDWDWEALFHKARLYGCERGFALGLLVANRLLAWPLPMPVRQFIGRMHNLEWEYRMVLVALQEPESWRSLGMMPLLATLRARYYQLRLHTGLAARLREVADVATSNADWLTLPLPDWLFFLYFPLRPFLVAWRHIERRLNKVPETSALID